MITYNHAPYIRKAVDGVLAQEASFPFELVIGEDFSTDGTREIVLAYERAHPHVIRVVTSSRNVGMHANADRMRMVCRGDYIAFCEGDDHWHDVSKLRKQVDFLQEHPDYVLVHSDCDLLYVRTAKRLQNYLGPRYHLDDARAYEEILTRERIVQTLTVLAKRGVFEAVLKEAPECSDPKYLMGDIQVWLELSRRGKVKYLAESLATHNMLEESATHSRNPEKELRFALSARDLIYHYVEKYDCSQEAANAAKASATLIALEKAWKAANGSLGHELFKEHRSLRRRMSPHALLLWLGSQSRVARAASVPLIAGYLAGRDRFVARY